MAKDPVCGMHVDEKTAAGRSHYRGITYYFCAPGCMQAFDEEPGKFISQNERCAKDESRRNDAQN